MTSTLLLAAVLALSAAQDSGQPIGGLYSGPGYQFVVPPGRDTLLEPRGTGFRHRPSGFECVPAVIGTQVRLVYLDPDPTRDVLDCGYWSGENLDVRRDYKPEAVRYTVRVLQDEISARDALRDYAQSMRARNSAKADHQLPATPDGVLKDSYVGENGQVFSTLVWRTREWLVVIRGAYPNTPQNAAETAALAKALFENGPPQAIIP